jgi:anti-sigma B factor antagonist
MGSFSPLTVRTGIRNGIGRMTLHGELDVATVPAFQKQLGFLEKQRPTAIVLDLRYLAFMDAAALRAFLDARQRAARNGHRLVLAGANRNVRRVVQLTGMEFLIDERQAAVLLDRFVVDRGTTARRSPGSPPLVLPRVPEPAL